MSKAMSESPLIKYNSSDKDKPRGYQNIDKRIIIIIWVITPSFIGRSALLERKKRF